MMIILKLWCLCQFYFAVFALLFLADIVADMTVVMLLLLLSDVSCHDGVVSRLKFY